MQSAADPTTLDLMAQVIEGFATEHDELSAVLRPSWAQVPPHLWVDRARASFELHAVAAAVRAAAAAYREADLGVRRSLHALAELASGAGLLTEGTRMPGLVDLAPSGRAPTSVGEALAAVSDLGAQQDGRVRVVGVPQPDHATTWIVLIPGTQSWEPRAGSNPLDVTTDLLAMAGQWTIAARAVAGALERAQALAGRGTARDPVLLVGHSQGGILAMALAADRSFVARHDVTHVVTAGSPVAGFTPAPTVHVLSLEHAGDLVPELDLRANPGGPSWLTIRAPVPKGIESAHDSRGYALTASGLTRWPVSADVSAWLAGVDRFFPTRDQPAWISELRMERAWQGRTT